MNRFKKSNFVRAYMKHEVRPGDGLSFNEAMAMTMRKVMDAEECNQSQVMSVAYESVKLHLECERKEGKRFKPFHLNFKGFKRPWFHKWTL